MWTFPTFTIPLGIPEPLYTTSFFYAARLPPMNSRSSGTAVPLSKVRKTQPSPGVFTRKLLARNSESFRQSVGKLNRKQSAALSVHMKRVKEVPRVFKVIEGAFIDHLDSWSIPKQRHKRSRWSIPAYRIRLRQNF